MLPFLIYARTHSSCSVICRGSLSGVFRHQGQSMHVLACSVKVTHRPSSFCSTSPFCYFCLYLCIECVVREAYRLCPHNSQVRFLYKLEKAQRNQVIYVQICSELEIRPSLCCLKVPLLKNVSKDNIFLNICSLGLHCNRLKWEQLLRVEESDKNAWSDCRGIIWQVFCVARGVDAKSHPPESKKQCVWKPSERGHGWHFPFSSTSALLIFLCLWSAVL